MFVSYATIIFHECLKYSTNTSVYFLLQHSMFLRTLDPMLWQIQSLRWMNISVHWWVNTDGSETSKGLLLAHKQFKSTGIEKLNIYMVQRGQFKWKHTHNTVKAERWKTALTRRWLDRSMHSAHELHFLVRAGRLQIYSTESGVPASQSSVLTGRMTIRERRHFGS